MGRCQPGIHASDCSKFKNGSFCKMASIMVNLVSSKKLAHRRRDCRGQVGLNRLRVTDYNSMVFLVYFKSSHL